MSHKRTRRKRRRWAFCNSPMMYFVIGEDTREKLDLLASLKAKWLTSPDSLRFDYDVLYARQLSAENLKKSLLALPAISAKRVVLIHEAEKLNEHHAALLLEFAKSSPAHAVVILESTQTTSRDALITAAGSLAKVHEFRKSAKENVFDMTRVMLAGRSADALKTLADLLEEGVHPLQIMGGVVWAWGNQRGKIPSLKFEQGLKGLQEADINIKRSRLTPECALELLVVQLSEILSPASPSSKTASRA